MVMRATSQIANDRYHQGHIIRKSVRIRETVSSYFSRTFGAPTNQNKWAMFAWVRRSVLFDVGSLGPLLCVGAGNGATSASVYFGNGAANDDFGFTNAGNWKRATSNLFRDTSGWAAVFIKYDSANQLECERSFVEIDGRRVRTTSPSVVALNETSLINASGVVHHIGRQTFYNHQFGGYLAEFHFVDGQDVTSLDFGYFDPVFGQFRPKVYKGAYGNNGCRLEFLDAAQTVNSNVGLGKDTSGRGNYWVTNSISTTAGVTYDSMNDTPSVEYATLSNLDYFAQKPANGNLYFAPASGSLGAEFTRASKCFPKVGTTYWECYVIAVGSTPSTSIGVRRAPLAGRGGGGSIGASVAGEAGYHASGNKNIDGTTVGAAYGNTYGSGANLACFYDSTFGALYFGQISGGTITWQNSGVPTSGASKTGAISYAWSHGLAPCFSGVDGHTSSLYANFGQQPFVATNIPAGAGFLCSRNFK